MKKILLLAGFTACAYSTQAQLYKVTPVSPEVRKALKPAPDKLVSYEITLNQILVAEATRDRIDNNDCRKTWGDVMVYFKELDANGQITPNSNIQPDLQDNHLFRFPANVVEHMSASYFQDRRGVDEQNVLKRISVRVSENMVKSRRIVAIIESSLITAHKDNDFASYDLLMNRGKTTSTFYLQDSPSINETMSLITDNRGYVTRNGGFMLNDGNSDDHHRIWLNFTIRKK